MDVNDRSNRTKPDIRHVVVLMFENRSFDHLLGHLDHDGLVPIQDSGRNRVDPFDETSAEYRSFPYDDDYDVHIDPGHRHQDIVEQMQGRLPPLRTDDIRMNGFVKNYLDRLPDDSKDRVHRIMGWHTGPQTPTLTKLARGFTTCSRWFSSVPGETWPNRMFAHAGHSHGLLSNKPRPYSDRTVFDAMHEQHKSWAVYAGDIPQVACYLSLKDVFRRRLVELDEFFDDVENDTLPEYSFIEPHHLVSINSQHPDASVYLGDQLLRRVYRALAGNPRIWEHLLFIVTWDEHGGFYDREPPPRTTPPVRNQTSDDEYEFAFDRLGVRVPAVVISPWSASGVVSDKLFDHTSIIRTVFEVLDIDETLGRRDAKANSVLVTLGTHPKPPLKLDPAPHQLVQSAVARRAATEQALTSADQLDGFQTSLLELKEQLDQARGLEYIETRPGVTADVQTGLNRLVHQFRAEHMGSRGQRVGLDHDS